MSTPGRVRPCTRSTSSPGATAVLGYFSRTSRPTIIRMIASVDTSPTRAVPTRWPSRRTVTRSPISASSSSRWEM